MNIQGVGTWDSAADGSTNIKLFHFGNDEIPADLQVGDDLYYLGGGSTAARIGPVTQIEAKTIYADYSSTANVANSPSRFIFYVKNAEWQTSGLLGYYAEVTMHNTAAASKELYSVGAKISISS